jgi:hypothetical protein
MFPWESGSGCDGLTYCEIYLYSEKKYKKTAKKGFTTCNKGVSLVNMSQNRFARVGDLLPAVLKSLGLDRKLKQQEIISIWPEVVGTEIAARTQAYKVDKGVLFVRVDHSAWILELHFMEKEILKKLKSRAPEIDIKRIRFGTGA